MSKNHQITAGAMSYPDVDVAPGTAGAAKGLGGGRERDGTRTEHILDRDSQVGKELPPGEQAVSPTAIRSP